MVHRVIVEDQSLRWYGRPPKIADNSIEFVQLQFHLPEEWASLLLVAQFTQSETYNMLMTDDRCFLPVELKAGLCKVSLFGYSEGKPVRATSIPLVFQIEESGFVSSGETPIPPTPDLYAQLIEYFSSLVGSGGSGTGGTVTPEDIARAVEDYLTKNPPAPGEPGAPGTPGEDGEDGGYYTPDVSQPDADNVQFSFAASEPGMPAVPAVTIPLPKPDSLALDTTLTQEGKAADAKAVGDAISKLSGGNVDLTGYATEQYVNDYAQPKGEYLTEVPEGYAKTEDIPTKVSELDNDSGYLIEHQSLEGYAKTEDIPTKPEDIGAQPSGNYLTAVPDGYAKTEDIPTDAHINSLIDTKLSQFSNAEGVSF